MIAVGHVWLLWGQVPYRDQGMAGDHGLLVGVYAGRDEAREAAAEYRKANRDGGLLLKREDVLG